MSCGKRVRRHGLAASKSVRCPLSVGIVDVCVDGLFGLILDAGLAFVSGLSFCCSLSVFYSIACCTKSTTGGDVTSDVSVHRSTDVTRHDLVNTRERGIDVYEYTSKTTDVSTEYEYVFWSAGAFFYVYCGLLVGLALP